MGSREWYIVDVEDNFYNSMIGEMVDSSPRTIVLKFRLNSKLGGVQIVQFFKEQLIYDGTY